MQERTKRPFFTFPDEAQAVWKILFERQAPRLPQHATRMYLDGFARMGLTADHIPDFARLEPLYQEWVGWDLVSTDVQFSEGQEWFEHLQERLFLVTEYIRPRDSLDYTPLPDIFHDAFGHLPFMTDKRYADLVQRYAVLMLNCPQNHVRKGLGSVWWYTIEFGLMRENGAVKAFGTGLMSSFGELDHAFSDAVARKPFDADEIMRVQPSPHAMHDQLWILEDFAQLEAFVDAQLKQYGIEA